MHIKSLNKGFQSIKATVKPIEDKSFEQMVAEALNEDREQFTYSEERNLYSGTVEPADQWFYEDMVEDLLNERGASFYIFDRDYSNLTSANEEHNQYEASSKGFKEFCEDHPDKECFYLEVYDHSAQAFHLIKSPHNTHDRWDSSIIGFVAIPSDINENLLTDELDKLWNGWYHEYRIVNNQTGDTVDSEIVSSFSELSDEFKNEIHKLELEDDFKSYIYESSGKKIRKKKSY